MPSENTHSNIPSNVPFSIFSDWSFEKFHFLRTFGAGVSGNSCSRPLRRKKASDSRSRIMGMDFFIPFPFPNFGNGFFHSLPVPEFWEWFFFHSLPVFKFREWNYPFLFPFPNSQMSFPLTPEWI